MNVGARRSGDSSPTDSGIDTSEWEGNHRGLQLNAESVNNNLTSVAQFLLIFEK